MQKALPLWEGNRKQHGLEGGERVSRVETEAQGCTTIRHQDKGRTGVSATNPSTLGQGIGSISFREYIFKVQIVQAVVLR